MKNATLWLRVLPAALVAGLVLLPGNARAQVGAIGAAPPSMTGGSQSAAGLPILTESAFVLGKGQVGATGLFAVTSGSVPVLYNNVDFTVNQLLLGAYYAPTDKSLVGVIAAPYQGYDIKMTNGSVSKSGRGDAGLYGKTALWQSPRGETRVAGFASLMLPIGDSIFGREGAELGVGVTASHQLERVTLHASAGIDQPTSDKDGKTALNLTGAGVYAASPKVSVVLEGMLSHSSGASSFDVAPGVRVQVGKSFYLSGAVLANLSSSLDQKPYSSAVVIGGQWVR